MRDQKQAHHTQRDRKAYLLSAVTDREPKPGLSEKGPILDIPQMATAQLSAEAVDVPILPGLRQGIQAIPSKSMTKVAAAIVFEEDKVLVTRRALGQKLEGYWEFPGGKLETGESPQECIIRELAEELSVVATAGEEVTRSNYHYASGSIELIAIAVCLESKSLELSVHDRADWVPISNLLRLNLAPADIAIAEYLVSTTTSA